MKKIIICLLFCLVVAALLAGCGLFSDNARLAGIEIAVDGSPDEWEPFPVVHDDQEGDNISIEYDISTIKAFSNNQTKVMYILVQSYIPAQEITSIELDLQYGDEIYRLGMLPGDHLNGTLARQTGADDWEVVTTTLDYSLSSKEAAEMSFSMEYFPAANTLKIAGLRVMGGVCCNQFEYYAIDYMNASN